MYDSGQGFGTGLDFKVPYFELKAEAIACEHFANQWEGLFYMLICLS